MAKTKRSQATKKPISLFAAARAFLEQHPQATPSEMVTALQAKGTEINLSLAQTYTYRIRSQNRDKGQQPRAAVVSSVAANAQVRQERAESSAGDRGGIDDLLRAAGKLGWQRVKEIVDRVVQAPA